MLIQPDVLYPEATSTTGKHFQSSVLRISHTVDIIFNEIMNTGNKSGMNTASNLRLLNDQPRGGRLWPAVRPRELPVYHHTGSGMGLL